MQAFTDTRDELAAFTEPLRRVMAQLHERWLPHAQDGDVQHILAREPQPT
jgi:hypothetical protein